MSSFLKIINPFNSITEVFLFNSESKFHLYELNGNKFLQCLECNESRSISDLIYTAKTFKKDFNGNFRACFMHAICTHNSQCQIRNKTCQHCKGTGKITLFTSISDCECVK